MSNAFVTGDRVVVLATGEQAFVTGYYLPGMDVRVLLESGRFEIVPDAELRRGAATVGASPDSGR